MQLLSDYNFHIPPELIAQYPAPHRTDARLLALQGDDTGPQHCQFPELLNYLRPGDTLVLNNTKVFHARFSAHRKDTGGKVEVLLSRPLANGSWQVLAKARKGLKEGTELVFAAPSRTPFTAKVIGKDLEEPGAYQLVFSEDPWPLAEQVGQLPLPPYLHRLPTPEDEDRYQTVFANPQEAFAVAAPTAGLHFDTALLEKIAQKGIKILYVTLHVGPGTFLPIKENDLSKHRMHSERWHMDQMTANELNKAKEKGNRIVAVGTTSVRTLESALLERKDFIESSGETRLFIRPGFQFKAVDALITNFHLPQTTLLMLVAAFIGKERLLKTYEEAIQQKYRFFSYGDACYFELRP